MLPLKKKKKKKNLESSHTTLVDAAKVDVCIPSLTSNHYLPFWDFGSFSVLVE
jgi:hypothetical protein